MNQPTPAPIEDIVGPVWFWPYPLWMTVGAAILVLAVFTGLVLWLLQRRPSRSKSLLPREAAMRDLDELAGRLAGMEPYAFGIAVSDVLRTCLTRQHGLRATTQTSPEFLAGLSARFDATTRERLAGFLERTDLLKYARAEAAEAEMREVLENARGLVNLPAMPEGASR